MIDDPIYLSRRSIHPTVDGNVVIQEMGYVWQWVWRFQWITTPELQEWIGTLEGYSADGWFLADQRVERTPVTDPLDLYNARITLERYTDTV